ncbi:cupin domain-containing protein [Desertibaculum subflavum]|uniref:cupin domain-containing protein n=1 Tax=Desertibaculum subflavum TaxID=2268458 RepID=UPI000E6722C4
MFNYLANADRRPFAETGFPGVTISPIWNENGNGADFIAFKAGAVFPNHDHEGLEEIYMISGKIRFGDIVISAGDYLSAGPGDVHDAEALEDTVFYITHVGGPVIKD